MDGSYLLVALLATRGEISIATTDALASCESAQCRRVVIELRARSLRAIDRRIASFVGWGEAEHLRASFGLPFDPGEPLTFE